METPRKIQRKLCGVLDLSTGILALSNPKLDPSKMCIHGCWLAKCPCAREDFEGPLWMTPLLHMGCAAGVTIHVSEYLVVLALHAVLLCAAGAASYES
eukprot:1161213-Pelagomonas_calceolata.AAC.9